MKKHPRRHLLEWSAHELKWLRIYARRKVSSRIAAQRLGRSAGATRYKAMTLGLHFRSINRRS